MKQTQLLSIISPKPFAQLAEQVVALVPAGPERTVSLRKLLETKDAAVRAVAIGASPLSR